MDEPTKKRKPNKIYWRPARLVEDPLTGEVYTLMFGGSGRIRYVLTSEIQGPIWSEETFKRNEK